MPTILPPSAITPPTTLEEDILRCLRVLSSAREQKQNEAKVLKKKGSSGFVVQEK